MAEGKIIVSVSRRSDIPAFFGEWFIEKVKQGFVEVPNPFNNSTYRAPLSLAETAAFVFWSKNFIPFREKLTILEKIGYQKFLFNYTITGLPEIFEPHVPPAEKSMEDFIELAKIYGREVMFWRFDPIIISDITGFDYHLLRFGELADKLAAYAGRCIFSFAFFYHKVKRSLEKLKNDTGVSVIDPDVNLKRELTEALSEKAAEFGIKLHACCCDYLLDIPGIEKSRCVDGELISEMYGGEYRFKEKPSRPGCGCYESVDIGQYGTCQGGCGYCYAG
ncbi:DUF1848 domain-containing protein [bacterium]|nr:DUF1848 domain-containing protein [FCB group bacterium]MBL7190064.1 DUF1848 domain-containing protein [bacterium]